MPSLLLKISGEAMSSLDFLISEIKTLVQAKYSVGIVIGGGNYWRARDQIALGLERSASDALGMMASLMNARALAEALLKAGVEAQAYSPHVDGYFAELYVPHKARKAMQSGTVVVLGGGTGNPYFTTDTAAALRALELQCNVLLKATKVDGVYDKDPKKYSDAEKFDALTYEEVLKRGLGIMDLTAITLCKENNLPVRVFPMDQKGAYLKAAQAKKIGTLINS